MNDGISIILAFNLLIPQVLKDPNEVDNDPLNFFKRAHYKSWHIPLSQADRYLCKVTFLLLLLRILPRFQNAKFGLWSSCCPSKTFELKPQRCWISMCCAPQPELILDTRVFFKCAGWSNKFCSSLNHLKVIHKKTIENWSKIDQA